MSWPKLVAPWACQTPVTVYWNEAGGEDGCPVESEPIRTRCCLDERQRRALDAEHRAVALAAVLLFDGDLAPGRAELAGRVELNGRRYEIVGAMRARDPDGRVNYTRLEVF